MPKLAIVTSDNYVDAVPYFFKALKKFWPEHWDPEVVYCKTVPEIPESASPVSLVQMGADRDWIENMQRYVASFGGEGPFLLMLEDYIIVDPPRDDLLNLAYEEVRKPDAAMVRVTPTPGPTLPWPVEGIGEIDKRAEYSTSLQAAIWDPRHLNVLLKALLDAGHKTIWDFELKGSRMLASLDIGHFLGLESSGISYKNLYRRGKKQQEVIDWMEEHLG